MISTQARREVVWATLGSIAFAVIFTFPLLGHLHQTGPGGDWDKFTEAAWASSYTVTHFGQLPQWDPFKCGGLPLLADPESRVLSPLFLLHLAFGTVVALNLELIIHVAIAWAGGYLLARLAGMLYLPAITCASLFPASSWIYLHFAAGHISFLPALYLPWILSMWLLSADTRQLLPAAFGGLLSALMYTEGGFYAMSFAAPLLATVAVTTAIVRRQLWPVLTLVLMAVFALGFASVKLFPSLALHIHRENESLEVETLGMLTRELFSRNQDLYRWLNGIQWGFYEYGVYLGPFFAASALLGAFSDRSRALPWIAGAFVTFALSAGSPAWWAPWPWLHRLPLYSSEHVPSRFLIVFLMSLAPLAGLGAEIVCRKGRAWTAITALILAAALADCWLVNRPNLAHASEGQLRDIARSSRFHQFADFTDRETYSVALSNQGALKCYAMNVLGAHAHAYNEPGYRGEQYLLGAGRVTLLRWTPNAVDFDVEVPAPTVIVANQNYEQGWQIAEGRGELFSNDGLIAVRLPAGRQHLVLVYRSPGFAAGLAITILTFVAMIVVWRIEPRISERGRLK